ncbi:MAG: hypothetical protein KGJ48_04435 [Nitrospirota bacterium]|nr:hypothetical protein [Nitrospirota bacterium]MDE3218369.1 hypothetical protein [Nitrospirota bacterium]
MIPWFINFKPNNFQQVDGGPVSGWHGFVLAIAITVVACYGKTISAWQEVEGMHNWGKRTTSPQDAQKISPVRPQEAK